MKQIAMLLLAAMLAASPAAAQSLAAWTDPEGHFSFQRPAGWPVDRMRDSSAELGHYAAGLASAECNFYSIARPTTAGASPAGVHQAMSTPLTRENWLQATQSLASTFHPPVDFPAMSVDTSGFFPFQRATVTSGTDHIEAAIFVRPGREVWVTCQSFDNRDRTELFTSIMRSLAFTDDAAMQAAIQAAPAAH